MYFFFMVDEYELKEVLHFGIQYIDSMRNEYIQEYDMKKEYSSIKIECGYPGFLEQFWLKRKEVITMPRTKGSKNRPKTNITKDYASQIVEKQEAISLGSGTIKFL